MFFLTLQKILGVGRVKLEFNKKGKAHIRYVCTNTEDIFNVVIPYFSLLYGKNKKRLNYIEKNF
jgi:hypothetical protein